MKKLFYLLVCLLLLAMAACNDDNEGEEKTGGTPYPCPWQNITIDPDKGVDTIVTLTQGEYRRAQIIYFYYTPSDSIFVDTQSTGNFECEWGSITYADSVSKKKLRIIVKPGMLYKGFAEMYIGKDPNSPVGQKSRLSEMLILDGYSMSRNRSN